MTNEALLNVPQWVTSSRLLKTGEHIDFHFSIPSQMAADDASVVDVFPTYLEQADPEVYRINQGLGWLEGVKREQLSLKFIGGRASIRYAPKAPGNYLARWRVGNEVFYRYFAVVNDDYIVINFTTFMIGVKPSLHDTGVALDQWLSVDKFRQDNPDYRTLLQQHRHYGDTLMPMYPETPELTVPQRVAAYRRGLERARSLLPDAGDARAGRIGDILTLQQPFNVDPGYSETFMQLGLNNLCGFMCANEKPWLGMPQFPYFASPVDGRKVNQGQNVTLVAHQWDFAGSWHFLGPPTWHFNVSENWDQVARCLRQGIKEFANLTKLSGHPAFVVGPIFEGVRAIHSWPKPGSFRPSVDPGTNSPSRADLSPEAQVRFLERYVRFLMFEATKQYKIVFARSIDVADYYRQHFLVTPRTVFVSMTDHVMYDTWWIPGFLQTRLSYARQRMHWFTRISTIMDQRRSGRGNWKYYDPMSLEFVLVEDQQRSIRFERECPNPIWWFDYTTQERGPKGSTITHTETPDVDISRPRWVRHNKGLTTRLDLTSSAAFQNYAICIWGLPKQWKADVSRIETNAKEAILAKNTDDEYHLVLFFDLRKPSTELSITLRTP
ncbi:MAG: hypothetical protein ACC628_24210 [Pirellulaceae bacterium]